MSRKLFRQHNASSPPSEQALYQFGFHTVESLLRQQTQRVKKILLQQGRSDSRSQQITQLAKQYGVTIEIIGRDKLNKMIGEVNHQGIVAYCRPAKMLTEIDLKQRLAQWEHDPLLLILDGIQDPHNLGACLRSADAAGVDAVLIPKDHAVGLNTTVSKVACGATESLTVIQVSNLARAMNMVQQQGIWIYGLDASASKSLYQQNLTGGVALVLGAEEKGLRQLTRENCDILLSIPMSGTVSSLNVSVATGICLFEANRQRMAIVP